MKARRAIAWLSLLGAISLFPDSAWPTNASCGSAPQQLDDWETAAPEDVGLDAAVLCMITQELAAQGGTAARPDRRGLVKWGLVSLILGLILGAILALIREALARTRTDEPAEYAELAELWRSSKDDLLHPWRPLRRALRKSG